MKTMSLCAKLRLLSLGSLFGAFVVLVSSAPNARAQWGTSGTNVYYNGGNVGIGTNNPSELLHVFKSAASGTLILVENSSNTNGAQAGFRAKNDSGDLVQVGIYGSGMSAYGPIGSNESYLYGTKSLTLMTDNASAIIKFSPGGNAERMRITANGSVGVGTATPNTVGTLELGQFGYKGFHFLNSGGGARLTVTGAGNASSDFIDSSAAANQRWFLLQNISGKAYYRGVSDTGGINYELMTFDLSTGNIGIGTTSPGPRLDVAGAGISIGGTAAINTAFLQDHTNYRGIYLGHDTAGQIGIIAAGTPAAASSLAFWTYSGSAWTEKMRINGSGNVGIGTTNLTSGYKLDVNGTINATGIFVNGSAINGSPWATMGSNIGYSTGNVAIGTGTPTTPLHVFGNATVTGNLTVGGNIAAKYQDVAEWVPSSEQVSAGTVVVLDPTKSNQVISSKESYDTRVAGVVSERPGLELGERGQGKVLVATTGRVLVKVDASRGPIHIGDLLVTSDISGLAMKSEPINIGGARMHRPGTLIGKALEPLEKGSGKILVLLSLQ
jgi:hypothetical protein